MEFIIIEFEAYKFKLIIMLELHFLIKNTLSTFRLKIIKLKKNQPSIICIHNLKELEVYENV